MILYLLKLEWKKAKQYTVFRVMFVLYLLLLPGMLFVAKQMNIDFDNIPIGMSKNFFFEFPTVFDFLGYVGNWLSFFFLGFIAVITVTSEFSNKTLRQNIITGMTRTEFFLGKVIFIFTISLLASILYTLTCFVSGLIITEDLSLNLMTENIGMIPRYFLMCFGYTSFGLFLGILIRRTGIALFIYLCYVMFIELIIRYAVHGKIIMNKTIHFYPMNAVEDLTPANFPGMTFIENAAKSQGVPIFLEPWEAIITTCMYSTIFLIVAYKILKSRDL